MHNLLRDKRTHAEEGETSGIDLIYGTPTNQDCRLGKRLRRETDEREAHLGNFSF
jgi:hypothetical protein